MFRAVIAAALVYAYGHPVFDGYRPSVLDKPLQAFYTEVNVAAFSGTRVLATFDKARVMFYVNKYIERTDAELRAGAKKQ